MPISRRQTLLGLPASLATAMLLPAPLLASAAQVAMRDARLQGMMREAITGFLYNIGLPWEAVRVDFPLGGMPRPNAGLDSRFADFGFDWNSNSFLDGPRVPDDLFDRIQGLGSPLDMSAQEMDSLLRGLREFQNGLDALRRRGVDPVLAVAVATLAVTAVGVIWTIGHDIYKDRQEARRREEEERAEINRTIVFKPPKGPKGFWDPTSRYPDMFPPIYWVAAAADRGMAEAGFVVKGNAERRAQVSFDLHEKGMSVTTAIAVGRQAPTVLRHSLTP